MRVDIVTLFPSAVRPLAEASIIGRAQARGLTEIVVHDLRFWIPPGERADDAPFGGGPGMVMRLEPLVACLEELLGTGLHVPADCRIIVPSPAGARFDHAAAVALSRLARLILLCGHYEGIDERLFAIVDAHEVSLGDFVVTGGEIPALAIVDAAIRLIPGVIDAQSAANDSFAAGALDWPHYTRPATFRGHAVPDVLRSGDHAKIDAWRRAESERRTRGRRPDLKG